MVGLASPLAVVLLKAQWMEEILWVKNKWAVLGVDRMAIPVVVVLPEALLMDAHSSLLQRLSIFKDLAQLSIFQLFNKRRKYTVERARSSFKLINRNFTWTEHRSLCSSLVLMIPTETLSPLSLLSRPKCPFTAVLPGQLLLLGYYFGHILKYFWPWLVIWFKFIAADIDRSQHR